MFFIYSNCQKHLNFILYKHKSTPVALQLDGMIHNSYTTLTENNVLCMKNGASDTDGATWMFDGEGISSTSTPRFGP